MVDEFSSPLSADVLTASTMLQGHEDVINTELTRLMEREREMLGTYHSERLAISRAVRSLVFDQSGWEGAREDRTLSAYLQKRLTEHVLTGVAYRADANRARAHGLSSVFEDVVADVIAVVAKSYFGQPDVQIGVDVPLAFDVQGSEGVRQHVQPDIVVSSGNRVLAIVELSINKGYSRDRWCSDFLTKLRIYEQHPDKPKVRFWLYSTSNFIDRIFSKARIKSVFSEAWQKHPVRGRGNPFYLVDKDGNLMHDRVDLWRAMAGNRSMRSVIDRMLMSEPPNKEDIRALAEVEAYKAIRPFTRYFLRQHGSTRDFDLLDPIEFVFDDLDAL